MRQYGRKGYKLNRRRLQKAAKAKLKSQEISRMCDKRDYDGCDDSEEE